MIREQKGPFALTGGGVGSGKGINTDSIQNFLENLCAYSHYTYFRTLVHTHIIPIFRTYERHTPKKMLQNFIKFFIYKVYTMRVCAYILFSDVHTHFHKIFR